MERRPTPTAPLVAAAWVAELGRTWSALPGAYGPFPVVTRRRREATLAAFADAAGAPRLAWAHRTWSDVLGPVPLDGPFAALATYAEDSGTSGRPASSDSLEGALTPAVARAVRGAIALAALAALADQAGEDLRLRVLGRRPLSLRALVRDSVALSIGTPLLAPVAGWSMVGWGVRRVAPSLPPVQIERPSDASLLAHVVADAAPRYLGGALTRFVVARSPLSVAVGVRSGRQGVTVRIGRGALSVSDGVAADVLAVLDGEIDELLDNVGDALATELSRTPEREGPKD